MAARVEKHVPAPGSFTTLHKDHSMFYSTPTLVLASAYVDRPILYKLRDLIFFLNLYNLVYRVQ